MNSSSATATTTPTPDGRTLHKEHLDAVFPANPVLVGHVSMHGAVLNSAAMRKYGISADTPTPPGGVIVRKDGSNDPEGLVMETAYLPIFSALPIRWRSRASRYSRPSRKARPSTRVVTQIELAEKQQPDPMLDVVPDRPDGLETLAREVRQFPVLITLSWG